jgi:hypothetical protein
MMKKINLMILVLLVQLVFAGSVQARCNLELFRFGSSVEEVEKELGVNERQNILMPSLDIGSERIIFVRGEEACKGEKHFEGASVGFRFLYDKLVQMEVTAHSIKPRLINWAESIYGEKEDKPKGFQKFNAQWTWQNFNSAISYLIQPDEGNIVELVIIQSRRHRLVFEKFYKEQEGGEQ